MTFSGPVLHVCCCLSVELFVVMVIGPKGGTAAGTSKYLAIQRKTIHQLKDTLLTTKNSVRGCPANQLSGNFRRNAT